MERALDPAWLGMALGEAPLLPTPEELSERLAGIELNLLTNRFGVSDDLIATGWYLHSVGSTRQSAEIYGVARQRAAFQVAAHIFDLVLKGPDIDSFARAELTFASQIAYMRSELDPNALAIYRTQARNWMSVSQKFGESVGLDSLRLGSAILALDANYLFPATESLKADITRLSEAWDAHELRGTPLAAAAGVSLSVRDLLVFLTYGRFERRSAALERLLFVLEDPAAQEDRTSRWVAAHLLEFAEGLGRTSIWTALPPDTPEGMRRAFSLAAPRVASLWPPQVAVLSEEPRANPLNDSVRRAVLSMPTSAGKTFLGQLVIASHLASGAGGVCYVAPTRSLCNEVRNVLDRRLRNMSFSIGIEMPDFLESPALMTYEPDVEVMTPERLAYLIRTDADSILQRFTLFVFDEAHTVADESRGWTLETVLTYLHASTLTTPHRIILMSAALGNRGHFVNWLSGENLETVEHHHDWRGPRRLHCIWATRPDRTLETQEKRNSNKFPLRFRAPLHGYLHIRTSTAGKFRILGTEEPIGELVVKEDLFGKRTLDQGTTPKYMQLLPLIDFLSSAGSVLVIEATRDATSRLASAIADSRQNADTPGTAILRDFLVSRLGGAHPLVSLIERGVAYHHGSLPLDVRGAIEEAAKSEVVQIVVATTSLTEGINLPVKSVIVANQGAYGSEGYQEFIVGSRLVNAIGRAGRAAMETEGIVVLVPSKKFHPNDFDRFDPPPSDLRALSVMATETALQELAEAEENSAEQIDLLLESGSQYVQDFLSFVWFLKAELERLGSVDGNVDAFLERTLAWQQLELPSKERIRNVGRRAAQAYEATPKDSRRRWAASGLSLTSSRTLEGIAEELRSVLPPEDINDLGALGVELLISNGRLERLLGLREAPPAAVHTARRGSGRKKLDISVAAMLEKWLSGESLGQIGDSLMPEVESTEYRSEQVAELVSGLFEHFLPWVTGVLVSWANEMQSADNAPAPPWPTDLSAYIRWGVDSRSGLELFFGGIQSRRLAHAIVGQWRNAGTEASVVDWLRTLNITQSQELFLPSRSELLEILHILRPRGSSIAADVLSGGTARVDLLLVEGASPTGRLKVAPVSEGEVVEWGVWSSTSLVGTLATIHHEDIAGLMATGLDFDASIEIREGQPRLLIGLSEPIP